MAKIVVEIMPKQELLDPQGKAVGSALQRAGHTAFSEVRVGKRFELTVEGEVSAELLEQAKQIAADTLSNSVIEDVVAVEVSA
ncbi:MAG: phosphoribosylformylglycinamidine synthase subunit PurS [Microbacteriaceae bacterium]|nr:phosphoribosylformylglycinamidine synthase subunit PurS [Microbacteriaceae bacterium]